ncbi:hypothetical protein FACS189415_6500 [Bacteroidia bacterium]|nr:hypothetical protein FACS18947_0800 [Bacteroidia bacterium]GHU83689.1 hypothetical protein FACS189415_6500 [Bacteroidia bacterium]
MQNDTLELISGAYSGELWERLEDVLTNEDSPAHIHDALKALHDCRKDTEAFALIHVLYDVAGLVLPDVVDDLDEESQSAYVAELLTDIENII